MKKEKKKKDISYNQAKKKKNTSIKDQVDTRARHNEKLIL